MSGATYGAAEGGTYGGSGGFVYGGLPPEGYWITLTAPDGSSIQITDLTQVDPVREAEGIGDWQARTGFGEWLEDWVFSEVLMYHYGSFIFRGYLETVDSDEGAAETVISGRGVGRDLVKGSDANASVRYQGQAAHVALQDYLDNHSSIGGTVATPSTETLATDDQLQDASTTAELDAIITGLGDTVPLVVSGDEVKPKQTAFHLDARDQSGTYLEGSRSEGGSTDYVDGFTALLEDASHNISATVSLSHTIPEQYVGFAVRMGCDDAPEINFKINGTAVDQLVQAAGVISFGWKDVGDGQFSGSLNGWEGGDLSGSVDLDIEVGSIDTGAGEAAAVDWIILYDQRYYTNNASGFDDTTDANDQLSGPDLYPTVDAVFEDADVIHNVTRGKINATLNDTSGDQALAVSNDQGSTWLEESNVSSIDKAFSSTFGTQLRGRVTLGPYGSRTSDTPTEGFNAQALQDWELLADGDDLGVIDDRTFTGNHLENIQDLASAMGGTFVILHAEDRSQVSIDAFVEKTKEASWTVLNPQRKVDVTGYANKITGYGAKLDDTTGIPAKNLTPDDRLVATLTDSDEVSAVGQTEGDSFIDTTLDTLDDLKSAVRSTLGESVNEDELKGTLEIVPQIIDPAYTYTVSRWSQDLQLESVSYTEGPGDAAGVLSFDRDEGIAEEVSSLKSRQRKTERSV